MSETLTKHDPFLNKEVEISHRLTDRLRGRYACGPTLPNGEPEFGWREFETPPIQKEAAQVIDHLRFDLEHTLRAVLHFFGPEGAEKVTGHVLASRKARDSNDEIDKLEVIFGTTHTPDKGA